MGPMGTYQTFATGAEPLRGIMKGCVQVGGACLESLIKRFVSQASQVSGSEFLLVVPGVEGSFGGANGSGDGEVGIGRIG
jgi:hypothetical protein